VDSISIQRKICFFAGAVTRFRQGVQCPDTTYKEGV